MKLLPIPLPPLGAPPPLGMWGSDFLWRYSAPPSPLAELKTQLPPQLSHDPRLWQRDDVAIFLRFCEREFDLPKFDLDLFQMNGKALCLLTKNDLAERIPGAGDVLHNVLQMLSRESQMMHKHLPSSPVTPTSRYPFSPHSQPPTPNWSVLAPPDSPFHAAHFQQLMQSNSVTLSPAPSIDSQGRSPPQYQDPNGNGGGSGNIGAGIGGGLGQPMSQSGGFVQHSMSSSNQSDSDEDSYSDKIGSEHQHGVGSSSSGCGGGGGGGGGSSSSNSASPPVTPLSKEPPLSLTQQITNVVNSWSVKNENGNNGSTSAPSTPGAFAPVKREFFPDTPEPNTNGRLLWDFLQQLLNDSAQRYSNFIAWKCRETGVFKIVDPAGLAKLWGIQKNHLSMNYDKMSRALRYYYRVNILRKVQGERHCYQFLRNPTELKSIKNISLLRQQSHQAQNRSSAASNTLNKQDMSENLPHHLGTLTGQSDAAAAATAAKSFSNNNTQQQQQQQQHMLHLPNGGVQQQQQHSPQPPHLHQQQQQQLHHHHQHHYQNQPSSPRVLALNGAFHHLSTSSPTMSQAPVQLSPHLLHNGNNLQNDFKMEPDTDDLPTDLSTGSGTSNTSTDRKYGSNNVDCYPLIRNSNGLTTIRLICQNGEAPIASNHHQSAPSLQLSPLTIDEYSSSSNNDHHVDVDRSEPMPTDLRKID